MVLLAPEHDQWSSGEHNGTFRGDNYAFVTGAAALNLYWNNDVFAQRIQQSSDHAFASLAQLTAK